MDDFNLKNSSLFDVAECNLIALGEIATITLGCQYPQYDWPSEDLQPFTVIKKITGQRIQLEDSKYIRVSERERARFRLKKGDIIFKHSTSSDQLAKSVLFDLDHAVLHTKYLRIRANEGFDSTVLFNLLNSLRSDGRLHRIAIGNRSMFSIRVDELKKIRIPLTAFASH